VIAVGHLQRKETGVISAPLVVTGNLVAMAMSPRIVKNDGSGNERKRRSLLGWRLMYRQVHLGFWVERALMANWMVFRLGRKGSRRRNSKRRAQNYRNPMDVLDRNWQGRMKYKSSRC
jgi:hypothetical protein